MATRDTRERRHVLAVTRRAAPLLSLAALGFVLARGSGAPAATQARAPAAGRTTPLALSSRLTTDASTMVEMRNVDFHAADGIVLHIRRLDGEMRGRGGVVNFDDPTSYVTTLLSAEVALRGPDLTHLMNDRVFAYRGAPLRHLHIELRDGEVWQRGTLRKGVDMPFEIAAAPALMPDGRIRLHPTRVRILGVNGLVLMRALGLTLDRMVDLPKAKGIAVRGNDLLLDPTAVLPPPAIRGRLTSVRVVGDELVQVFGTPADSVAAAARGMHPPDPSARNFMYYRGGTLHFTKLFMTNAEMLVVDEDERDPFDFDNPHYQRQLVAGDSRTLPDLGLEVHMPDAHALAAHGTGR